MSVNLRVIAINDFDAATLTVTPAVVSTGKFSKEGLQDERRSRAMRTTATADQEILATWTQDVLISGIVIALHNLTSSSTGRVQAYSDTGATAEIYDSQVNGVDLDMLYKISLGALDFGITPLGAQISDYDLNNTPIWITPTICRAIKITLSDPANPDGYLQVGRVFAGRYIEPVINMDLGYVLTPVDKSTQTRTYGGTLNSEPENKYHQIQFKLSWLGAGDRERFVREFRRVGKLSQVYLSLFPNQKDAKEIDHQMIAKLTNDPNYSGGNQIYTDVNYTFEEA